MITVALRKVFAHSLRLYKANGDEPDTALSELFVPLFRRFFSKLNSQITPVFLMIALKNNAMILPSVFPLLLAATKSAASDNLRTEAFVFLQHAMHVHIGSVS